MRKYFAALILLTVFIAAAATAQEKSTVQVVTIAVCTSVENKQPAGEDSVFAATVGKLYCYTKLKSAEAAATVSHVWFFENKEMTKVDLSVNAKLWRTWSAKTILPEWKGEWRVEVRDASGNVLKTVSFRIK